MKNILLTIDFDVNTNLLVNKACNLGQKFKAKIWLLHVAAPEPDFIGYKIGPQYIRDSRASELRNEHKALQELADQLKAKGVEAEGLLIYGATIDMIIEESVKLKSDLIIVGYHEHGLLYRAFNASKSFEIIKKSKVPVMIIPLDKGNEQQHRAK